MKVLGISGSPNKNGNTAYAVQYGLDLLKGDGIDTRFMSLAGRDIHPCIGCWKCTKTGKCQFDDYMTALSFNRQELDFSLDILDQLALEEIPVSTFQSDLVGMDYDVRICWHK